ncbi:MAG: glycine cleavage system aminomethyltransferase GcvT [Chloroflexota bacterium]|nr:glycine cleavage system aminomethyltransferase GcvT [Chloroflexota bacterium]
MDDARVRYGAGTLTGTALLRTALDAAHERLGARMVEFAGWYMPIQYPSGILAEHQAVRTACGVFDLSHMGRVFLRGRDALPLAQACCTRDLSRIRAGEAAYSLLCAEDGGILDDVIAYVREAREVLIVCNASGRERDVAWFTSQRDARRLEAAIEDRTVTTALIGVQGPAAQDALARLTTTDLDRLPGYAFVDGEVAGAAALIARTGYTGEDGFEVMVEASAAERLWTALLAVEGVSPAGLGARDTLRTEAGFALYGHEIDEQTNPFEARLGWVVNLDKPDFLGREALAMLKAQRSRRVLVGLQVDAGGVPRADFPILHEARPVGRVTSGTYSPTLRRNIALGYVPRELSGVGQVLEVETRGRPLPARVERLPFVPHRSRPRATM